MCGIGGLIDLAGMPAEPAVGERLLSKLAHRGPDGHGLWSDDRALLAHTRLAIRDLSPAGSQPLCVPAYGIVVVFNGEIYNYDELRSELSGASPYIFVGSSDTEIIPAGYLVWGEKVFDRLEGMFSIALWDPALSALFLARDAIGIKPLYFSIHGDRLAFASEIKALPEVASKKFEVNPFALHTFFAQGYVGPDQTTLKAVRQLAPGTVARFDADGLTERQYWKPRRQPVDSELHSLEADFGNIFSRICHDMLVSDVPVGVLQSGGIDSTLISLSLNNRHIPLFCGAFRQDSHNESRLAQLVADKIGARLVLADCDDPACIEEDFRLVVWHLDGQLADPSAFAAFRLFREVRRHLKVVLSGDGADEFFLGYDTYAASRVAPAIQNLLGSAACERLGRFSMRLSSGDESRYPVFERIGRLLTGAVAGDKAHAEWRRYLMRWEVSKLYGPLMQQAIREDPLAGYRDSILPASKLVDSCLVADQSYYLPADMLTKVDRMSMAHGLEVRVPFLDRRAMDFAGHIPSHILGGILPWKTKTFLRMVAKGLGTPSEVLNRRKSGFNLPVASMLRGALRPLGDQLLDRNADSVSPYLQADRVRALWREHQSKKANHDYLLWTILTFSVWVGSL
jgi:asparagine synthase (glutamine-hydrolysing)